MKIKDAIDLIHECGGIAILAHYETYNLNDAKINSLLKKLKEDGLDGMECFYGKMSPMDCKKGLELAEKYFLLKSIGSDFHGPKFNNIEVGKGINEVLLLADNKYFSWVDNLKIQSVED